MTAFFLIKYTWTFSSIYNIEPIDSALTKGYDFNSLMISHIMDAYYIIIPNEVTKSKI